MSALFKGRKINKLSDLGETLKRKRTELGFSLAQISKRTLIAERYLESIEREDWQHLPGEVYIRNFLKRYAAELSLDPTRVLKVYEHRSNFVYQSSIGSLQRTLPLSSFHFLILPKLIRNGLIILVIISALGYLGWQVNQILTPPKLAIYSPVENFVTKESQVIISGQTDKEVEVKINDIVVPVNAGKFTETIDLQIGLNMLKISASKKYGREQVLYRRIMWQPSF